MCTPNFCPSIYPPCGENEVCQEVMESPGLVKCSCKQGFFFNGNSTCEEIINNCSIPGGLRCDGICDFETQSCKCADGFNLVNETKCVKDSSHDSKCKTKCVGGFCINGNCFCRPGYAIEDGFCIKNCSAISPGICPNPDECEFDSNLGFRCKCEGRYKLSADKVTCERKSMCTEGDGELECSKKNAMCKNINNISHDTGFECTCTGYQGQDEQGICRDVCDIKANINYCRSKLALCDMTIDGKPTCKCPPMLDFDNGICMKFVVNSYTGYLPVWKGNYNREEPFALKAKIQKRRVPIASDQLITTTTTEDSQNSQNDDMQSAPSYGIWKINNHLKESMESMFSINERPKRVDIISCRDQGKILKCAFEMQFESTPDKEQLNWLNKKEICTNGGMKTGKCLIPPHLVLSSEARREALKVTDPCAGNNELRNRYCRENKYCSRKSEESIAFECKCGAGYMAVKDADIKLQNGLVTIQVCDDINECEGRNPVCNPNSTLCENLPGSFKCNCKKGYKVYNESADPKDFGCANICDPNPCVHGYCVFESDHVSSCRCQVGYTGRYCNNKQQDIKPTESDYFRKLAIALGCVLGVLLVTVSFFAVWRYRKLQQKLDKHYTCIEDAYAHRRETELIERAIPRPRLVLQKQDSTT